MGARQRAQKRGKAPRGSQKGTPSSQKQLNTSMHVPDLNPANRSSALMGLQDSVLSSSPSNRKGFTMGDAARNTERHTSGWGTSKLRDQTISFVSAGTLHQEPEHVQVQDGHTQDGGDNSTESDEGEDTVNKVENHTSKPEINIVPAEREDKVEAVEPISSEQPVYRKPRSISQSSTSSSSSEKEQIVFKGRSKAATPNVASLDASKKNSRVASPAKPASSKDVPSRKEANPEIPAARPIPIRSVVTEALAVEASSSDRHITNSRLRRRGRGGRRQAELDEEEALMRDYIANMAMDDTEESEAQPQSLPIQEQPKWTKARKNETFRFYDGAGTENEKVKVQSIRTPSKREDLDQALDWNSDDLQDFDDLATSDGEVDEISQVLRRRERNRGPQYLVTPVGLGASDAKWILHERLVSESARKEIAIFEEILAMEFEDESFDDDDDEDDDDDDSTDEEMEEALNDLVDHIESEDDENARILKHTAKMTDEQIARALAKQEELGLGSDELMLFSGDIDEDMDEDMDANDMFQRNDDFISFSIQQHTSNRTRSKRNKKNRDTFPSAGAFADALDQDPYGGFDVMDFDRPSLRPKKKGRKSDFPYDLEIEDDDLRNQLVSTWMKDRDKKALRKQEKEEARLAMALEYADRGHPAAIKAEIRRFLMEEMDTLRLSPMESATRASVHRLAKALKLNSHSEGKEGTPKGRYPVLTKTVRTPTYTIDTVWEIDTLLNTRKFFPKTAGSYKKEKLPRGTARTMRMKSSGGISGASYMNGEVVGASAPELGADNKGRALLEKMGWSVGMAIGAEGNKGSLDHVKHVFRTSRAGLG